FELGKFVPEFHLGRLEIARTNLPATCKSVHFDQRNCPGYKKSASPDRFPSREAGGGHAQPRHRRLRRSPDVRTSAGIPLAPPCYVPAHARGYSQSPPRRGSWPPASISRSRRYHVSWAPSGSASRVLPESPHPETGRYPEHPAETRSPFGWFPVVAVPHRAPRRASGVQQVVVPIPHTSS